MRRDRIDIYADILTAIDEGATVKSHVMYRTTLNFCSFKKYINKLLEIGFIKKQATSWGVTQLGYEFLSRYEKVTALLSHSHQKWDEATRNSEKHKPKDYKN